MAASATAGSVVWAFVTRGKHMDDPTAHQHRQQPLGREQNGSESQAATPFDRRRFLQLLGLAGAGGAVLAACGGSGGSASSTTAPPALRKFPLGAASSASNKPVPVTFWHSMSNQNLTTLETLTRHFNQSQDDVSVNLVAQPGYPATLTAYTAALAGGPLPDLVQMETSDLQLMIDSQSVVAAQAAVDADHYDLSDFLPSTVDYFRSQGTLWAMPFNISTQVLYCDKVALEKAGLDPDNTPRTFDAVRAACQKIVSSGAGKYGIGLKLTSSNFEDWIAIGGGLFLDKGNGRAGRADSVEFGGTLGTQIVDWFGEMLSSKLADGTPSTGLAAYDNLVGIANHTAPITIDTSAALGSILAVVAAYPGVELGVGPMFGPPGPGGVPIGGAGLYMVEKSLPERQDGAWQFVKFLLGPDSLATWAVGTGYLPIRSSAVGTSTVKNAWAKVPGYKVAYDQLAGAAATPATAGGLSGAFSQLETDVTNMLVAIANGTAASTALSQAVQACNQAITSYNSRVAS
jgi:sn-glycerol 3-phosphate transport system substrate-binding protein